MSNMKQFDAYRMLLTEDRSIRRFDENKRIDEETLIKLIDLTRFCASGRNLQPLRYRLVHTVEECEKIFPALKWAGYLTDWDGPEAGERPAAYLVQCLDTDLTTNLLCDDGIQLQAITLGARALGTGSCIIKSFNVAELKNQLHIPENMKPLYVLALGIPVEKVVIEEIESTNRPLSLEEDAENIKYWRDENNVHHVPKRKYTDLIIKPQ